MIEYSYDPETINGLNLYAYCGNNPVMNGGSNGNFFITFLLISIGVGAVVGGAIAGVTAYNQGAMGFSRSYCRWCNSRRWNGCHCSNRWSCWISR